MEPLDRRRYGTLRTGDTGRVTFPTLIPGAEHMLQLLDEDYGPEQVKEKEICFTVQPGQTLDLGEITVKRPK